MSVDTAWEYALGHSDEERRRLLEQDELVGSFTARFLQDAGIASGMRVLDVGCGVGAVSTLVASLVGPAGSVVGVDTDGRSLRLARERARDRGLDNASFVEGNVQDLRDLSFQGTFDAVVGRFILMYLPDPAEVLRQLAGLVRPGGIVAFHEYQVKFRPPSVPGPVALWEQFLAWMVSAFERVGVETEMGLKLHSAFTAAGLPRPQTRMDVHLMGPDDPLGPRVGAHSLRSLLPVMERFGLARAEEVGIETFAERLHAALVADGAMTCWPPLVGAWTRVP